MGQRGVHLEALGKMELAAMNDDANWTLSQKERGTTMREGVGRPASSVHLLGRQSRPTELSRCRSTPPPATLSLLPPPPPTTSFALEAYSALYRPALCCQWPPMLTEEVKRREERIYKRRKKKEEKRKRRYVDATFFLFSLTCGPHNFFIYLPRPYCQIHTK